MRKISSAAIDAAMDKGPPAEVARAFEDPEALLHLQESFRTGMHEIVRATGEATMYEVIVVATAAFLIGVSVGEEMEREGDEG